jgi:manganese/zinc/iron transport system substrate-binding protein
MILSILVVLTALVWSGCGKTTVEDDGRLQVVATTGMIGDAVRQIAGDSVDVVALMGPGVDPHLYKATKGDLDRLQSADVIFYNGLFLEAKMAEILERMAGTRQVYAIGEVLDHDSLLYPDNVGGHPDPHIWFDLKLWSQAVAEVGAELQKADPTQAEWYRTRTKQYVAAILAEDDSVKAAIATIPPEDRVLVTAHDAFHYFGRRYGIEVKGLQGISTVTEAGLHDVTSLVDELVARKIKAVFVESSVSPKAIEAVVGGCRSRGHEVIIGGELFSDAMGPAGTPEGTYLGMVRHNVNTIVSALR